MIKPARARRAVGLRVAIRLVLRLVVPPVVVAVPLVADAGPRLARLPLVAIVAALGVRVWPLDGPLVAFLLLAVSPPVRVVVNDFRQFLH